MQVRGCIQTKLESVHGMLLNSACNCLPPQPPPLASCSTNAGSGLDEGGAGVLLPGQGGNNVAPADVSLLVGPDFSLRCLHPGKACGLCHGTVSFACRLQVLGSLYKHLLFCVCMLWTLCVVLFRP